MHVTWQPLNAPQPADGDTGSGGTGNGSSAHILRWYQDVSDNKLPVAWVISIPMLCYHLAMLAWALWISFGLISEKL